MWNQNVKTPYFDFLANNNKVLLQRESITNCKRLENICPLIVNPDYDVIQWTNNNALRVSIDRCDSFRIFLCDIIEK